MTTSKHFAVKNGEERSGKAIFTARIYYLSLQLVFTTCLYSSYLLLVFTARIYWLSLLLVFSKNGEDGSGELSIKNKVFTTSLYYHDFPQHRRRRSKHE
jgi:hypothetical protein